MDTAKAEIKPVIRQEATVISVNRSKGRKLIVPDELKEAKRHQKNLKMAE